MSVKRRLLIVAVVGVFSSAVHADTIYVDDDNCPGPGGGTPGDPYCSIQTAIDAAVDADEIIVAPGTYLEMIDFLGKAITLRSSDGPEVTVIEAQGAGSVVTCESGEGPDSVLSGLTITNGHGGLYGGGMYNLRSSPTVTDCTFSENTASAGGGMCNNSSSPTVTDCTFSGNGHGGMVNYADSSPAIIDCTFSGNTGGGMYNLHSSSTVIGCTFSGNDAVVGGGMRNDWSSPAIIDCTFSNNEATSWAGGGGMRNWHGSPIVIGCTFEANTADDGGGMHNGWNSPTVIGCMFSGNGAMEYGGGMYNFHSSLTVTNCTFTGNSATNGHALAFDSSGPQPPSDLLLANCILWGGGEYLIWNNDDSTINITYSNVQGGYPGLGNIDADPLFVDVPGGNYRLSPGSPCIDAGDNTAVPEDITTDLDGNPRFLEIPETDDTGNGDLPIVDMGAYESLGGGCLAITSQEVICHGDGSTFTVNAEGLDACTGGTTMVTFTGMGGAVGEDFCATLIVNSGEGGFCCSTQLCVLVPDCSGSALPCDLDGDGVVGVLDFLVLLGAWGTNPIHPADFDGDGDVGVTDLLILLANWG